MWRAFLPCVTRESEGITGAPHFGNAPRRNGVGKDQDDLQHHASMLDDPTSAVKQEMLVSEKMSEPPTAHPVDVPWRNRLPPIRGGVQETQGEDALLVGKGAPEVQPGQFVGIIDNLSLAWAALAVGPAAELINTYLEIVC